MSVTVIIPTFNREERLATAIKSVLSQSFGDLELIVVDDGSTDGTARLVSRLAEEHKESKVRYFYQRNMGPSAARNLGIKNARGRYIAFLDSDDSWKKNKLKKQMEAMGEDTLVSYTDEIWIRNGVRVNQMKKHAKHSGWIFSKCLPLCVISPSSVMIERSVFSAVGCFDESLRVCEDYDLWLRISNLFYIYCIHEKLIVKIGGHSDQISRESWGNDIFRVKSLIKVIENQLTLDPHRKMAITELKKKCRILYSGFIKRNKVKDAELFRRIYQSF